MSFVSLISLCAVVLAAPPSVTSRAAASKTNPFRSYLARELPAQSRALDHGTISASVHGGLPAGYRVSAGLGLLDHVSFGASATWWPTAARPRVAPWVLLTAVRTGRFAVGASYDRVLHPPAGQGVDAVGFERRTDLLLGNFELFQSVFAVAVEAGAMVYRQPTVGAIQPSPDYRRRTSPAGGVALRVGTRRWGVTLRGRMPLASAELALDVRFGVFEFRGRGGWTPAR